VVDDRLRLIDAARLSKVAGRRRFYLRQSTLGFVVLGLPHTDADEPGDDDITPGKIDKLVTNLCKATTSHSRVTSQVQRRTSR